MLPVEAIPFDSVFDGDNMPLLEPADCLRCAESARRQAAATNNPAERATLLCLANEWERTAAKYSNTSLAPAPDCPTGRFVDAAVNGGANCLAGLPDPG